MAEFTALETWAGELLHRMGPQGRQRLIMAIARGLRKDNVRRMQAQRGPDGNKWEVRKQQKKVLPAIRYLYDGPYSSREREIEMSSYRRDGDRIIGYDKEAKDIRTIIPSRATTAIRLKPKYGTAGSIRARLAKAQKMMQGMPRFVQALTTPNAAVVEIVGRAQRIAAVHHHGLRDRVKPGGPMYNYPARELLGIAPQDRQAIEALLLKHLGT